MYLSHDIALLLQGISAKSIMCQLHTSKLKNNLCHSRLLCHHVGQGPDLKFGFQNSATLGSREDTYISVLPTPHCNWSHIYCRAQAM